MVCGLGGSGKSHLLRFLAFHPALPEQLGTPQAPLNALRIYLDCNAAIADDAAGVFRALLLETATQAVIPIAGTDMLATLRTTLAAQMDTVMRFVIVLDRFERIPTTVQPGVLDGLRHLRDYLDRRVSYVVGSRTPPPIAELSEEFDDLLAAPPVVWVGPLADTDAAWNVQAVASELGMTPDKRAIAELTELSGGHPRLLRAVTVAWAEQATANPRAMQTDLLANTQVTRICEALCREFDDAAQTVMHQLAVGEPVTLAPTHPLRRYGVVQEIDGRLRLGSALLAQFLQTRHTTPQLELTALEQRLWEIVQQQPNIVLRRDELIETLYGDNPDGINDEALTALVARLRRKLMHANMGTLEAVRGLGYRFRPTSDTGGWQ